MKNDYDDYDDYETGASRWVSVMVLLLAVAGFLALAWYAYHTGSQQAKSTSSDVVVVEAEETPIKEKPEDAGGMEFPHQEKTIFDALSASGEAKDSPVDVVEEADEAEKEVAQALEEAEKPAKMPANEKISAVIQDAIKEGKTAADEAEDVKAAEDLKAPEEKAEAAAEEAEPKVEEAPKAEAPKEQAPKAEAPAKAPDPFAPVEKETTAAPAPAKPQAPAPAPVKPVETVAPKTPAPAPVAGGKAQIQLGAYGSQAEAEQNWARIRGQYGDLVGSMPPQIVRADLGAKGVFYRLRVAGFGSVAAAKQTCSSLSSRGQGCFLVQ